jgi:hypothetical protein
MSVVKGTAQSAQQMAMCTGITVNLQAWLLCALCEEQVQLFCLVCVNMAEKVNKIPPIVGMKPVPMKLFATWEVDRTPPNCIPRYCDTLNISYIIVP